MYIIFCNSHWSLLDASQSMTLGPQVSSVPMNSIFLVIYQHHKDGRAIVRHSLFPDSLHSAMATFFSTEIAFLNRGVEISTQTHKHFSGHSEIFFHSLSFHTKRAWVWRAICVKNTSSYDEILDSEAQRILLSVSKMRRPMMRQRVILWWDTKITWCL